MSLVLRWYVLEIERSPLYTRVVLKFRDLEEEDRVKHWPQCRFRGVSAQSNWEVSIRVQAISSMYQYRDEGIFCPKCMVRGRW